MRVDAATNSLVRSRARGFCEYCRLPEAVSGLPHVTDHVIARQHRGDSNHGNLALACQRCNLLKGPNLSGLDPRDDSLTRLFHPRIDAWSEHFHIRDGEIVGVSAEGR